jgi:hypothetical protein
VTTRRDIRPRLKAFELFRRNSNAWREDARVNRAGHFPAGAARSAWRTPPPTACLSALNRDPRQGCAAASGWQLRSQSVTALRVTDTLHETVTH